MAEHIPHRVGVFAHPLRPETLPFAEEIAATLQAADIDAWVKPIEDDSEAHPLQPETDLVVAIGGDGAMFRAARLCAPDGVPVLGIHLGRLGFLTEIRALSAWPQALQRLLEGSYWIEERMMIHYEVWRSEALTMQGDALNDVVVARGDVPSVVWLETYIDHGWTTTYVADALVIATPTGSTAYAMAAGGPILPPELRNILVVPVAPHLSMDRPIVVSEGSEIDVFINPQTRTRAVLTADGVHTTALQVNDRVTVRASKNVSRFVRMRERTYFYRSLLDRFEPRHPSRQTPRRRF